MDPDGLETYPLVFRLGEGPAHAAKIVGRSAEAKIEIACETNMWWRHFVYKRHLVDEQVGCILCINGGRRRGRPR